MASFNKVILVGNLTRNPHVKYTTGGTAIAEIGLAVSRQWFDKQANEKKEETTFVDVTFWGRTAEVCGEYLTKGRPVLVEGRLQLDQWKDKESGQNRQKLKVVGEVLQMLGSKQHYDDSSDKDGHGEANQAPESPKFSSDPPENEEVPF